MLNWLALAGWGSQSGSTDSQTGRREERTSTPPDSTDMLTLDELIEKVWLHIALYP